MQTWASQPAGIARGSPVGGHSYCACACLTTGSYTAAGHGDILYEEAKQAMHWWARVVEQE